MRILFSSRIEAPERWLPLLQSLLPRDEFTVECSGEIDVAIVASPRPGTLGKLGNAKLIQSLWMGVEALLADPDLPRNVPLARLVDPGMAAAMTETVLAHTLDWHRRLYRYREQQKSRTWKRFRQYMASDHTVGILGMGALGTAAAARLLPLGFNVVGWSRRPKAIRDVKCSTDLSWVLSESHVVVCLLPLTAQTKGILNAGNLKKIREGGGLINCARGAHVARDDLIAVLDSGHLAHAWLDVFEKEPLPADDPLWAHPKVSITPHAAALTEPRTAVIEIAKNIEAVRRGERPPHLVDFSAGY
ncbi:MAG TPA: glyoxylate/hydroxypyruvate reductase A [Burkholderiales bacterium]|nr:glyoxylate/hydroxypyruvate reductase A [Burkholderiales bacterium]